MTDHLPITITINWKKPKAAAKTIRRRCYKNFNETAFLADLHRFPWKLITDIPSPDDKLSFFNEAVSGILNHHAPEKRIRVRKNPVPWITKSIRDHMDARNRALKSFRQQRTEALWNDYKSLRNSVTKLVKKSKLEYFSNLLRKNSPPSAFWQTLKSSVKTASNPYLPGIFNIHAAALATLFNNHFATTNSVILTACPHPSPPVLSLSTCPVLPSYTHSPPLTPTQTTPLPHSLLHPPPLKSLSEVDAETCSKLLCTLDSHKSAGPDNIPPKVLKSASNILAPPLASIINTSFKHGSFPTAWKHAIVKPLHKGGDKLDLRNYRPISILPATSKIIERLAKDQLMDHCKDQLHQFQSGFRPYHSTTTALLQCTNDWLLAMDKGLLIGVVFLDVSKAFDSTTSYYYRNSNPLDFRIQPSTGSPPT